MSDIKLKNQDSGADTAEKSAPAAKTPEKAVPKLSKRTWAVIIVAALIVSAAVLVAAVSANYALVGSGISQWKLCDISASELDLNGLGLTDVSALSRCSGLRSLDLRGNSITPENYSELRAALPECEILWSIPLGGDYYDSDITKIALRPGCEDDLENLLLFGKLTDIDARACTPCAELVDVYSRLRPGQTMTWELTFGEAPCDSSAQSVTLGESSTEEIAQLEFMPNLTYVDATACTLYDRLIEMSNKLPDCEIVWAINVNGVIIPSNVSEFNLSGTAVTDYNSFFENIKYLPKLTYIDMCDCGLTNEQMASLRDTYTNIKFVWKVSFLRFTVRTDITCFSTLWSQQQLFDQDDFAPLFLYCRDLVALDLGHNSITDVTMLAENLTKLEGLILGDNHITDISPLANLKELNYLELWRNRITDISPLTSLPKLTALNLTYNPRIEDFSPLYSMKGLKMLWLQHSGFPRSKLGELQQACPDATISYYVYNNACGNGWCATDQYLGYRNAFKNWRHVVKFTSWADIEYVEGAPLVVIKADFDK